METTLRMNEERSMRIQLNTKKNNFDAFYSRRAWLNLLCKAQILSETEITKRTRQTSLKCRVNVNFFSLHPTMPSPLDAHAHETPLNESLPNCETRIEVDIFTSTLVYALILEWKSSRVQTKRGQFNVLKRVKPNVQHLGSINN